MTGTAILTVEEMRGAEQALFDGGVAPYALMETAGAAAAEIIWRAGGMRDTLILCGPGNNGGDGFVIARCLKERGVPVRVAATGESRTDSSRKAREAWGGVVESIANAGPATQVVDAVFGIGLTRGLDAGLARLGELVDAADRSYAIDVPSGVDSDGGVLLSPSPRFDLCIALGALKPAHVLQPASRTCARLVCVDIGIATDDASVRLLAPPDLTEPMPDTHKYTRGLVEVVAGTMAGAGILASSAAAHAGAGCVRHLAPEPTSRLPDAVIIVPAASIPDIAGALEDKRISAVLVGPGLGRSDEATARLRAVLASGHRLVVDADGITLLGRPDMLPEGTVVTPHDGEFSRLFGEIAGNKIDRAREAARRTRGVVVYKGPDTVIAAADGRVAVSHCGSPWLSTAGTGDVLAGICVARLAMTGDPFRAACEGVWLHGEAARRAGPAFIADDLIRHIPAAIASRTQ